MSDLRELYSEDELFTLEFDDGAVVECGNMGIFGLDGLSYIVLQDLQNGDLYLYRYVELDDEFELVDITDDEEFDRASQELDRLMETDI